MELVHRPDYVSQFLQRGVSELICLKYGLKCGVTIPFSERVTQRMAFSVPLDSKLHRIRYWWPPQRTSAFP